MQASGVKISRSPLEEARFSVPAARVVGIQKDDIRTVMAQCREEGIRFLVARVLVPDIRTAQALEREGFLLMDTLVYYSRDLRTGSVPVSTPAISVRPMAPGEHSDVLTIAARAFRGYFGHYHADPRLDQQKSDEAYIEWAEGSCARRDAENEVLVAEREGAILGFITLRMNNPSEGEGLLIAVDPSAQGSGIGRSLMIGALQWCASNGSERMIISTQLHNLASQKVWVRLGFEPSRSYYTFHRWFDVKDKDAVYDY